MRVLRNVLALVLGVVLGGGVVSSYAATMGGPPAWVGASGMVWKAPDGSIRSLSNPFWEGFSSATNGGVEGRLGQKAGLAGGGSLAVQMSRNIPAATIGRLGAQLAKVGGPLAIGLTLAPLVWDAAQGWMKPAPVEEACPQGVNCQRYWYTTLSTASCRSVLKQCSYTTAYDEALVWLGTFGTQVQITGTTVGTCDAQSCAVKHTGTYVNTAGQPRGAVINMSSGALQGTAEPVQATDQDIADTIIFQGQELDRMSDLAQRILQSPGGEAAMLEDAGPLVSSGPSSIQGPSSSSTSSGPSGQTTNTTNTTYNITYNSNVIEITSTTTSTTIAPDGTTTETVEESATEEQPPPEEPTPFCEQFPDASACQPLGETPDQEIESESRNVGLLDYHTVTGTCPSPMTFSVSGHSQEISYQYICDGAVAMRPLLIALGMLSAGIFAFSSVGKQS